MLDDFVDDEEVLYRRIEASRNLYKFKDDGTVEIYSPAFGDRHFKISVDRAKLCHADPKYTMGGEPGIVAWLKAGQVRGMDDLVCNNAEDGRRFFKIDVVPAPSPENPAHAEIYSVPEMGKSAFHRLCRRLAQLAEQGQWIDLSKS